ncbi:hypothetical protein K470DRAFT_221066 [Piedraia hortae CBS 480.64]|uniref:Nucleotidyltransferase family protein n=1 Tax=Piedraia hortae CBS 480.64 TaxID=1314780 RepID=A0A6A7BVJ5_9PEZI|nr:hypothetical protein K470DRAFT_221066 [Piedraia hortae CBS 480.64]
MDKASDLSDAAIAIYRVLGGQGFDFGIFGGYAVTALEGPRESKDIDCAVACNKETLAARLTQADGFIMLSSSRSDVVGYIWGDRRITVKFYPAAIDRIKTELAPVTGRKFGRSLTRILDPVLVFKGKLSAASMRIQQTDAVDLIWLGERYPKEIKKRTQELSRHMMGQALRRHPYLESMFQAIVGDEILQASKKAVMSPGVLEPSPYQLNIVQNGLFFGL